MAEHVERTSQNVDCAERNLNTLTKAKEPTYTGFEQALAKFRDASQDLFFLDLHASVSKDVENRLWAGHLGVNQLFRQYLGTLRREENRKKTVERRKAEKLYLDFIKSSQRFYRGFIQRVCSHFDDVSEIYAVARKMHLDTTSVDPPVQINIGQKHQLIRSCHMALIQCGDLSRYREIELTGSHKERNWGPAKGYYECAAELDPTSGHSFNQLSVMALADGDHFRALYYVYRCLAMPKRFPGAPGNLMSELKKLRRNQSAAKLDTKLGDSEVPFLNYHGRCYADSAPDIQAELDGVFSKLSAVIVAEPCNASLRKMCLINISASKHAIDSAREPPKEATVPAEKYAEAWNQLQKLNIAHFTVLLQLLSNELLGIATAIGGRLSDVTESIARLTPICRRVLPCLRLYSAWLLTDLEMLHRSEASGNILGLKMLWLKYAECLSYLSELFPLSILDVPYLLEEEKETLHFTPFSDDAKRFLHLDNHGKHKPYRDECNVPVPDAQRPDIEMLFRIKGLLRIGAHFVKHSAEFGPVVVPLVFEDNQFEYRQAEQTLDSDTDAHNHGPELDLNGPHMNGTTPHDTRVTRTVTDNMEDMVDDLVGADPAAASVRSASRLDNSGSGLPDGSSKDNSRPASTTFTASDLVRQISQGSPGGLFTTPVQQHGHRASIGISQDPFAPLPGEFGSRPSTSHQASPRLGNHRSSGFFNDEIAKRQRAIEDRSSPLLSLDQSTVSNTPSGLYTLAQNRSRPSLQQDQWQSPFSSSAADAEFARKPPTPSRFGAIGDSRPRAARTPTSAQPE